MPLIPRINDEIKKPYKEFDPLAIDCPPTDNISTADYIMVGDFPNNVECMEQEPFIGPYGSQLNRACAAINIPRYKIYLTLACKTPVKNINKLHTAKGFRHPSWGELQSNLIDELSKCSGKVIILLGTFPMKLLLDEPNFNNINTYRGSVYKAEEFPHLAEKLKGKYIALSLHPRSTLARMQPVNFYIMIADFKKFAELSDDHSLLDSKVIIKIRPTFNEVMDFYSRLKKECSNEI